MSPNAQKVWSIAVEQYRKAWEPYVEYIPRNGEELDWALRGVPELYEAGYIEDVDDRLLHGRNVPIPCIVRFQLTDRGRTIAEFGERKP